MVPGLPGVQSQAIARIDGRLKVGVVSARLDDGRKPTRAQVVKEFGYMESEKARSVFPLRQTARLTESG